MSPKPTRLLLCEDHRTLREGLKLLLQLEGDIEVVAETDEGKTAVRLATEQRPEVVLMDVALVGLDGIEATRQIHAAAPAVPVLILSAHAELHLVRAAVAAGAIGYLLKRASGAELREGVRAAAAGQPHFSPELLPHLREKARGAGPDLVRAEHPAAVLTPRETEILQLIAAGHSNREIAEILQVSVKTVETHRLHLMEKLDIHEVASLTRYAIRKGLLDGA